MRHRLLSLDRKALMPLALAVVLVGLFVPTASAAPKKPYRVAFSHPSVPAGVTVPAGLTADGYKVTLTNLATTQQIGSADITAPAAYTLVGEPALDRAGTPPTVAGNVISLRDLSLPPGQSVTVTIAVRMPCVSGSDDWNFIAKQSNDFSGTPGNDSGPIEGSRTTTVTRACVLKFVDQPAGTEKNEAIRAVAFNPASDRPVTVEALDGSDSPQRLDWFTGSLTMALESFGYFGRLDPAGTSATAVAGLASFAALRVDLAGVYNLRATATDPGFVAAQSARFTEVDIAEDCDSTKCTTKLTGRQSTSTLTGAPGTDTGFVVLSLNIGPDPDCGDDYTPPTSDWYEFEVTAAREKTIDVAYTRQAMRAFGDPHNALEICYAAPVSTAFTVKGGGDAEPFDYDGDGPGEQGFIGLLPDCTDFPPPCVTDRSPLGNGAAQISFAVPAAQGDPRFH